MANKKRSDRERLLKLIDGDASTLRTIQKRNTFKVVSTRLKELVFLLKERIRETFRRLIKGEISLSKLNLLSVRMVLVGILSIMIIYLVFDFISAHLLRRNEIILPAKYVKPKETAFAKISPLGYYLDQIGGKELFTPQRIAPVKAKGEIFSRESYAGLKLVGVDWGGDPVALIEDTQTQKTYFVKKGDSIKELKVMEIFKDRVKLGYDNKIVELK